MIDAELVASAQATLAVCRDHGLTVTTAESCTGGLVAASLTAIAGSSEIFDRGFVTYSNNAKMEMLGVPLDLLMSVGAVSKEVAHAMATGALEHSSADLAVSVTGIAGPGGATVNKPVGLVHLAAARRNGSVIHEEQNFSGGRDEVRCAAAHMALQLLQRLADESGAASGSP
ncbi:MAG: damage-inducible protein CinA [Rhodospirillaceae bacterium]|nr:damage-inducible protein CinA [Rhodospirillaceae bacterium]|tara:strand:+ start:136 stop:651 length:516 start_codon:yes stop_codon:yes gene_type:complete